MIVVALKESASDLVDKLKLTNVDQRIVSDFEAVCARIPTNSSDFSKKIFSCWFSLRPFIKYAEDTRGQHSEYIEAAISSFELNLRGTLASYPAWREYEAASVQLISVETFEDNRFIQGQADFEKFLRRNHEHVDDSVPDKLSNLIHLQELNPTLGRDKPMAYGVASSLANIISRIFQRALKEIADGAAEGLKTSSKNFVVAAVVSGGGLLVWFLSNSVPAFSWLAKAYSFLKGVVGIN